MNDYRNTNPDIHEGGQFWDSEPAEKSLDWVFWGAITVLLACFGGIVYTGWRIAGGTL